MSNRPLDKKIALVTGASRGIGHAIALRLAQDGAHVVAHYGKTKAGAEAVVAAIEKAGGTGCAVQGDFGTIDGIEKLVEGLCEHTKGEGIDILVNNAGIQTKDGLSTISPNDFDHSVSVNLRSPFFLVQKLLPHLNENGRIVNVSSGLSLIAFPDKMVYSMLKAALNSFTRSLAKELGPRGITVNAVLPGITGTDMNPWARSGEGRQRVAAMTALGRAGEPDDIADTVAALCGPDMHWVTGNLIEAGGGMGLR